MNEAIKMYYQPPHITYKHLLDKGEDLTTGEVVFLLNKEVDAGKIAKAANMTIQEVRAIGERSDKYIENHKKVVMKMGVKKHEIEEGRYNDLKKQGYSDKDIADKVGMSQSTLSYHKKKWSQEIKPRTPKLILAEGESVPTVHEDLIHDLSKKLRKAEFELDVREKFNGELEKKISELEEQIKNLHAAAEDTEKEVAASHEYIEREQELMEDAGLWKHQAEVYKKENVRLNDTLSEVREELKKSKGENLLFRAVIKEVII